MAKLFESVCMYPQRLQKKEVLLLGKCTGKMNHLIMKLWKEFTIWGLSEDCCMVKL